MQRARTSKKGERDPSGNKMVRRDRLRSHWNFGLEVGLSHDRAEVPGRVADTYTERFFLSFEWSESTPSSLIF